ncbi:hypothetical protein E4U60_003290 [Claviceps pazoutovae]|uniref:60S ribosomal subunit assembly/export protein LOC1 n=1 Tax=Claviceps pazoutovae TaxID=1649127 RepID=A0A9P7MA11_9HYPO|nr:hypothetical protein E4U60_003290 [Claviceps pazoutovae]
MAPSKTRTVKNKHAGPKGGSSSSSSKGGASAGAKRSDTDGITKRSRKPKGPVVSQQVKEKNRSAMLKKPKKKIYTEAELGIPALNMVTPVGVVKPKGKKKGKIFVDDTESMSTIMAMVQAEKDGEIESKMIKARKMEEIREARKVEAQKKDEEKKSRLEDTKDSLRKKRKRKSAAGGDDDTSVKALAMSGSKATKTRKKVAFA